MSKQHSFKHYIIWNLFVFMGHDNCIPYKLTILSLRPKLNTAYLSGPAAHQSLFSSRFHVHYFISKSFSRLLSDLIEGN